MKVGPIPQVKPGDPNLRIVAALDGMVHLVFASGSFVLEPAQVDGLVAMLINARRTANAINAALAIMPHGLSEGDQIKWLSGKLEGEV